MATKLQVFVLVRVTMTTPVVQALLEGITRTGHVLILVSMQMQPYFSFPALLARSNNNKIACFKYSLVHCCMTTIITKPRLESPMLLATDLHWPI